MQKFEEMETFLPFELSSAVLSTDSAMVLTVSRHFVTLWSVDDGSCMHTFQAGSQVVSAAFSEDNAMVLLVSSEGWGTVQVWSVFGICNQIFTGSELAPCGYSAMLSADNTMVIIAYANGAAKVFSVEDGSCKQIFAGHDNERVFCTGFSRVASMDV